MTSSPLKFWNLVSSGTELGNDISHEAQQGGGGAVWSGILGFWTERKMSKIRYRQDAHQLTLFVAPRQVDLSP